MTKLITKRDIKIKKKLEKYLNQFFPMGDEYELSFVVFDGETFVRFSCYKFENIVYLVSKMCKTGIDIIEDSYVSIGNTKYSVEYDIDVIDLFWYSRGCGDDA